MLQAGGWALLAIVNILFSYVQGTLNSYYIFYALLVTLWFIFSSHIFRYFINKWGWVNVKVRDVVLKVFVCILLLTVTNFVAHIIFLYLLGILEISYDLDPLNILGTLLSTFFIYFVWTLFYFIYHYFEKYNTALKYEALKNEIELNNLKSQLNPHFIFNALNSIRALIDENPAKSKDAITQLSSILRSSLVINRDKLTSFNEEIDTVRDYLDLEKIRFEERLRVSYAIDPGSKHFAVPPLMIQTLVENGIKHGISKLQQGGEISLITRVENEMLCISIRNNGQFAEKKNLDGEGLGLANTRQRLKLLYGQKASFQIYNEDDNTVLTEVILPQKI
ncbi:MAG: histidine kinase [Cyclobacteriaceae bacterium]|nr:histidine kinase [Cyclobacteriaceae bacterium]